MNTAQKAADEHARLCQAQREAACVRRKLPITTSIEDLLDYEYRRGLQVAILDDDSDKLKKIAYHILDQRKGRV